MPVMSENIQTIVMLSVTLTGFALAVGVGVLMYSLGERKKKKTKKLPPEGEEGTRMNPKDFVEMFKDGRTASAPVSGICSRIIRIKEPAHRERLSGDDPSRRIVFVTNAAGSTDLLGKNGWDCLMHIGYPDDWVRNDLLPSGTQFELIVFPETEAKQATWENFLSVVATAYPEFAQFG